MKSLIFVFYTIFSLEFSAHVKSEAGSATTTSASEEKFDASDLFTDDTQKIEAFGRDVNLGGFYDLLNDRLAPSHMNFIHGEIPPWAKKIKINPFNTSHSALIHRPVDILSNFDVTYQEKANFLLGILPISQERAPFLLWSKRGGREGAKKLRGNVILKFGTMAEKLDIYEVDMESSLSSPSASAATNSNGSGPHFLSQSRQRGRPRSPYTHVVTGVQYGAVVSIQFEQDLFSLGSKKNQPKSDWSDEEIEDHLETQMEIVKNLKKGRELAQKYFKEFPDAPKFNMEITGDIPYDRDGNIDSLFEVLSFIQRVPENLKLIQDGKGYPISFDVTSLKDILANIALNNINSQDPEPQSESESDSDSDFVSKLKSESGDHNLKRNETEIPKSDSSENET